MSESRAWNVGDHDSRWHGYLVEPDSNVLRNKVGATTVEALRAAENDLLEFRVAELRARSGLVSRTYDLSHLKALHHQLFQDVYKWPTSTLPAVLPARKAMHLSFARSSLACSLTNRSTELPWTASAETERSSGWCVSDETFAAGRHRWLSES